MPVPYKAYEVENSTRNNFCKEDSFEFFVIPNKSPKYPAWIMKHHTLLSGHKCKRRSKRKVAAKDSSAWYACAKGLSSAREEIFLPSHRSRENEPRAEFRANSDAGLPNFPETPTNIFPSSFPRSERVRWRSWFYSFFCGQFVESLWSVTSSSCSRASCKKKAELKVTFHISKSGKQTVAKIQRFLLRCVLTANL